MHVAICDLERPRATVHRVIHSTSLVIVLTAAQKGMK